VRRKRPINSLENVTLHLSKEASVMQQSLNMPPPARPPCKTCGQQLWLTQIQPTYKPSQDLRTFECTNCKSTETVRVKF
jgi:predicted Zn-ribbon and HTH transcriptional regulator